MSSIECSEWIKMVIDVYSSRRRQHIGKDLAWVNMKVNSWVSLELILTNAKEKPTKQTRLWKALFEVGALMLTDNGNK